MHFFSMCSRMTVAIKANWKHLLTSVKTRSSRHLRNFSFLFFVLLFKMQHAAEISSGDLSDPKIERAMRQRDYFLQQTEAGQAISNTLKTGLECGVSAANALHPGNLSKSFKVASVKFRSMTWAQLIVELLKLGWRIGRTVFTVLFMLVATICRFVMNLMNSDESVSGRGDQQYSKSPTKKSPQYGQFSGYQQPVFPDYHRRTAAHDVDAFGIPIHHAQGESPTPASPTVTVSAEDEDVKMGDHPSSVPPAAAESPDLKGDGMTEPNSTKKPTETKSEDQRQQTREDIASGKRSDTEGDVLRPPPTTTTQNGEIPMPRPR